MYAPDINKNHILTDFTDFTRGFPSVNTGVVSYSRPLTRRNKWLSAVTGTAVSGGPRVGATRVRAPS